MKYALLLAVCLLAGSLPAQSLFGDAAEAGQIPSRFIWFDVYDAGLLGSFSGKGYPGLSIGMVKATCELGRFRGGFSYATVYSNYHDWTIIIGPSVHVGYTFWSSPRKTWFFWGNVPKVYAELSAGLSGENWVLAPSVRAAVCCDVDYYGLGAGLKLGVLSAQKYRGGHVNAAYVDLQVRLVTFGIGF
jgi:hypothetical protein